MNDIVDKLIKAVETKDLPKWQSHYQMLSTEEKEQIVQQNHYQLFHLAASNGQFEIFEDTISAILDNIVDDIHDNIDGVYYIDRLNEAFAARAGEGLRNALINQHAEIVKAFLIGSLEEALYIKSLEVILEEPSFIKYMYSLSLKDCLPDLLNLACLTDLKAVESVLSVITLEEIVALMEKQIKLSEEEVSKVPVAVLAWKNIFVNATWRDDKNIIEYLWLKVPKDIQKAVAHNVFPECFIRASKNGSFKALQGIAALLSASELSYCLQYEDYNTFVYSADRGNLEMLKWVWDNLADTEKPLALAASRFAAYRLAKHNNHQDVITFLERIEPG